MTETKESAVAGSSPGTVSALDSAKELLRAHHGMQQLADGARAAISELMSEAFRDLRGLEGVAEPGSEQARRARDGLQRFDRLLRQIAEAGMLPER